MVNKKKQIFKKIILTIFLTTFNAWSKINFSGAFSNLTLTGTTGKLILDTPLLDVPGIIMIKENIETGLTQTTTLNKLTFTTPGQLIYGNSTSSSEFTGTIDTATNTLSLSGGQTLNYAGQTVTNKIAISNSNNLIAGTPIFTMPITLQDSSTTVTLALDTKLTGSIVMNGGSIYLGRDLSLKDDVYITGSGTINFNGWSFDYPVYTQGPITSELTFINANDINVNNRKLQTSNTNFSGNNDIRGKGVIVDFTGGGSYTFNNNSTTYINNLHIKGLGSNGGGNLILNSNAKVYLTNCILDLDGDYTQTNGEMIVDGGNCKIISNPTSDYIVSGASTILKIDGQMLEYENAGESPRYPIQTTSGGTVTKINGGRISSNFIPGPGQETDFSAAGVNSISSDLNLDSEAIITFVNATPGTPKAMTLNGNFNTIKFCDAATTPIVVEENVTLTFDDVKLQNFDPARFDLQGAGPTLASVVYGDNVTLEIEKDLTLATGDITFSGSGTSTLNTNNSTVTAGSGAITVGGTQQLDIKNSKIVASATDSLKATSSTATLQLQASELIMRDVGMTWDTGNLKISDHVILRGASETTPEDISIFNFTTAGAMTIQTNSILQLDPDIEFLYDPDTGGDTASQAKRHFAFTDPSSTLVLNRANLNCGAPGLAINYGKVIVNDTCVCKTPYTSGQEFELGTAANLTISNNGILEVDGLIKYVATTYP